MDGGGSRLTTPSTATPPVMVDSVGCGGSMSRATGRELWAGRCVVMGAAMMDWSVAAADVDGLHGGVTVCFACQASGLRLDRVSMLHSGRLQGIRVLATSPNPVQARG